MNKTGAVTKRARREQNRFPGYAQVTEIGRGGMSHVYRAIETETNRPVALKVLDVANPSPHALETFQRETLALGSLSAHPHILTLYRTLRTADDQPLLVLELCRSSVLEEARHSGGLPTAHAIGTAIKLAGALETAHRANLLHRDVKPGNVLVTEYGEPVLADFGVACLRSGSWNPGVVGFTTIHAAPELLEGQPATPATDVYGLASSTYQLLCGRPAFCQLEGEAAGAVALRIVRDPVPPLHSQRDDRHRSLAVVDVRAGEDVHDRILPLALSDIVTAAMAKDPADRPASPLAFANALRAFEASQGWPVTSYAIAGGPADPEGEHPLQADVPQMRTGAPRPGALGGRGSGGSGVEASPRAARAAFGIWAPVPLARRQVVDPAQDAKDASHRASSFPAPFGTPLRTPPTTEGAHESVEHQREMDPDDELEHTQLRHQTPRRSRDEPGGEAAGRDTASEGTARRPRPVEVFPHSEPRGPGSLPNGADVDNTVLRSGAGSTGDEVESRQPSRGKTARPARWWPRLNRRSDPR